MKKSKAVIILFIVTLTLSACSNINEEEIEKKQFIEVADKSDKIIRQIEDEKTITKMIENESIEQWEIVSAIPNAAEVQYTYTSYELITEPAYKSADGSKISVGIDCLYSDGDNFYMEVQTNDTSVIPSFYKIPVLTGEYLEEIAGETFQIQDKENIFVSWGIKESEIANCLQLNSENEIDEEDYSDYDKYPYQDIEIFDYAGVKKTSKYQKIEIYADDKIVYATSDLEEIADILNMVDMQHWKSISEIPENILPLCTLKKYAHPKKQGGTELVESEYWQLYKLADEYYLTEHINAAPNMEDLESTYIIPKVSGEWFEKRIK